MELNISCIGNELNTIIDAHTQYTNDIILRALAAKELINIIKKTFRIPINFIQIIDYLKNYIDCYIDFDFLLYISRNNKKVILNNDPNDSENLFDKINDMIKKDTELLHDIIGDFKNDEYGKIDKDIIAITRKLFDLIDKDKDGYINALDLLRISNMEYILILESDFINIMTKILVLHGCVDYHSFHRKLF